MSLAKALGYNENDRLLLVNGDDFGLCHSVNEAIIHLLQENALSSATVMMPCGWAKEAAQWSIEHPEYDVGVHLTFTSEWPSYGWGPVSRSCDVSSLVGSAGHFPDNIQDVEEKADSSQVKQEMISQIEMALSMGLKPTHADNHMGSLYGLTTGRNFLNEVLDVCAAYGLPFRMPRYLPNEVGSVAPPEMAEQARQIGMLADSKGVVILDYLVSLPFTLQEGETYDSFKSDMQQLLRSLRPGVTELYIHPSTLTEELKAFHLEPEKREMEYKLFLDPDIRRTLQKEGIRLIRWRELQQLQINRAKQA